MVAAVLISLALVFPKWPLNMMLEACDGYFKWLRLPTCSLSA